MKVFDFRLAILNHAKRDGLAIAVEDQDEQLTYATLVARSAALSKQLRALAPGLIIGKPVAILAPRGAAQITALLAVARAGAAFMPIDPQLPVPRILAMLGQTQPIAMLHTTETAALAKEMAGQMMLVAVTSDEEVCDHVADVAPNNPSYLMFTSGSTGTPKGVHGRFKSLNHFIQWQSETFALCATTRTAQLAPVTFDVSLRDILTPLVNGGTVCVPSDEISVNPRLLVSWLAEKQISVLHCVPTLFRLMTDALAASNTGAIPDLSNLKHIFLAGEPLFGRDIKGWSDVAGDTARLVNLYGPSETTLAKLFHMITDADVQNDGIVPIGHPIPDTAVMVLKGNRLAAVGEIGEICIRTAYPSLGYINDAAATRTVFVRNPLGEQNNDIIYRSGDLGRALPDGAIECLGRLDNQVKIAGNRVEGGDVEAAARVCDGVGQCAVIIDRSTATEPFLIGYFTVESKKPATRDTLRAHLVEQLPNYMVPRFLVQLIELPLLMNGKINRRALPKPDELIHGDAGPTPPEGETEQILMRIWSEILGAERIGVETPFANLGGDSLKAIKVIARIYLELGRDIGLANFFKTPTIRAQASLLLQADDRELEQIARLPEAENYTLSYAQRRLWALQGLGMNPIAYNLSFAFLADQNLDVERLERAVNAVIDRHEILRTRFITIDGEPRQQPVAGLRLVVERKVMAENDLFLAGAATELAAERQRPFDLAEAPLMRIISMTSVNPDDATLLIFSFHHIICDGESLLVFSQELSKAYAAGGVLDLKPLNFQHRDFSGWQHDMLEEPARIDPLVHFWKESLGVVIPVLDLPEARPRPTIQRFKGDTRQLVMQAVLCERLRHLARNKQTTLFNVLLASLLVVLERHSGQDDIIVGTPVLGRNHPHLRNQIGFFANTLALRNQINHTQSISQLIAQVTERTKAALDHQDLPFDQLVSHLDLPRNLSRNPICDVLLVVLDDAISGINLSGVGIKPFGNDTEWKFSRFDLVVHVRSDNEEGELYLDINYDSDLFSSAQVDRLAQHMENVLSQMCESPELAVGQVTCLTASERALFATLDRSSEVETSTTIIRMFADIVNHYSHLPAVKGSKNAFNYRQLDDRAHDIAAELLRRGLMKEERVAVLGVREVDGLAAILGIMQAGGTYVPLDERWPEARISQVLGISGARRVLCALDEPLSALGCDLVMVKDIGRDLGPAIDLSQPESLAYIIFTSGSTGEPKGVMIEHASFCNMISQQIKEFGLTTESRVLQFAAPAFDGALSEIFMALLAGAQLVLTSQDVIENIADFQALLAREAITTITLPPSYLGALNSALPKSLTTLITAGESARLVDARRFADKLRFINAYGPAENSVCSTFHRIVGDDAHYGSIPIGKPIAGVGLTIVDNYSRLVPIGVPGEAILHGVGLARGYIGRSDLTAKSFQTDPHHRGRRSYHTGDFCAINEDGNITYIGRRDDQVKISGQRLELGDVLHILRGAPDVEEAVVTTLGDPADKPTGVGAWVKRRPTKASFWPSVAEFFVYDDIVYGAMATDNIRNSRYFEGFLRYLPGTTVMEVGPGPFAILSRLAIEAGARHVYAIEINPEVANRARRFVAELNLADRITVITGDAVETILPETVDWCISEIVGGIGGSEGAAAIINAIRPRLRAPENFLPRASVTKIAAVEFPVSSLDAGLSPLANSYVTRIFEQVGHPFDLRLCLRNFDRNAIISTGAIFENLDFTHEMSLESNHEIELTVLRNGRVTGFLLWLTMNVGANREIDILTGSSSWLPIYVAFDMEGIAVAKGDRFQGKVLRSLARGGRHQDYVIQCELHTADGGCRSVVLNIPHTSDEFRKTPLHRHLFSADGSAHMVTDNFLAGVRAYAAAHLPRYAAPRLIREVETVPLTVNGKIAYDELPALVEPSIFTGDVGRKAISGGCAETIGSVFRTLLGVEHIYADTSFFASGGDSIAAIRAVARLGDLGIDLTVAEIFQHQTVSELAQVARNIDNAGYSSYVGQFPLAPIQHWFIHRHSSIACNHFNQSVLLKFRKRFKQDAITVAINQLLAHHDILRGNLLANLTQPAFKVPATLTAPVFWAHDLRGMESAAADEEAIRLANAAHGGFDLATGPLFAALHFCRDDGDTLLLIAHHMVVDVVSWRILLTDLKMLLVEPIKELPARTASYGEIVQAMAREAISPVTTTEMPYWREVLQHMAECTLPKAENGDSRVSLHRLDLDPSASTALVDLVGKAPGALQAFLLRAAATAAAETFGWSGALIAIETNGRDLPASIPPSGRTVGWFTQVVPVWVSADRVDDPMVEIPRKGIGYSLLAWMRTDHPELRETVAPISLNFLGRLSDDEEGEKHHSPPFVIDWNGLGDPISPSIRATHPIDILAHFEGDGMFISVAIDHGALATVAATTFIEVMKNRLGDFPVNNTGVEDIDMDALAASLGL